MVTPSRWTRRIFRASTLALVPTVSFAAPHGEDAWPQYRGASGDGISTAVDWTPEGRAEPLWATEVGLGYSAVTVQDGRLFTMGYDAEAGVDLVWCLDPKTGEELWVHAYEADIWNQAHTGGTLTTPTIDGDDVYTLNREGNAFRFDAASGEVAWNVHLAKEHGAKPGTWGFAASPLVIGDALYLNVGKVVCMDKATGKVRWQSKDYGHSYSTPTPFELPVEPRGPVLAVFNGDGLAVIDRADGAELYFREWKTNYDINAASPVLVDDQLFISSGYNHGSALLAFGEEGLEVVWEGRSMHNQMSGCVLMNGHLYGFDDSTLKCIDRNGKEKWSERGLGNGALIGAADKLIVLSGKGELIVAEATPEEYRVVSKASVIDSDAKFWTTPTLVNGLIYCRDSNGALVCRDHRDSEQ